MPPDPTIPPTHQAHPYATLALRPGWLVSGLGVGARTGLNAEVTAYSIVFWGHDALPAQEMVAWQQEKARLMAEMSLAGQKGAYGKLGALSSGLNRALTTILSFLYARARVRTSARRRRGPGKRARGRNVLPRAGVERLPQPCACDCGADGGKRSG